VKISSINFAQSLDACYRLLLKLDERTTTVGCAVPSGPPESIVSNWVCLLICVRICSPVDGVLGLFTGISVVEIHPFGKFGFAKTCQTTQRPNEGPVSSADDRNSSYAPIVQAQANISEIISNSAWLPARSKASDNSTRDLVRSKP